VDLNFVLCDVYIIDILFNYLLRSVHIVLLNKLLNNE